jgi:hypothetical protein
VIAAAGLQCGFGEPLDPEMLEELREFGFIIVRLDLQKVDDTTAAILAQQVIDAGLQPLCTIRRPSTMQYLPTGSLMELGNEPDLEHEGWTVEDYIATANECVAIAMTHQFRLYLGAVSNLNPRGFNFLRKLPWQNYPPEICCSIHRYPDGDSPENPQAGSCSREDEVIRLRLIVGNRPLACTEVGYHDSPSGWTEEQVADHMAWERRFFSDQGFEICSAYQVNDGPSDEPIDHYGFRRASGAWKPVTLAFTQAV